jgi:hypothetical protein
MIESKDELQIVCDQLGRIEEALASLRSRVLPKKKRNFDVFSEGYVEMIEKLKAEIDEYFTAHPELCGPPNGIGTDPNGHAPADQMTGAPSGGMVGGCQEGACKGDAKIESQGDLQVVCDQLGRIERALADLRSDVLPKNKRNFDVFAEGYIEMIEKLKTEIDEYFAAHPELCGPPNGIGTNPNGHAPAEEMKEEPTGVPVQ